MREAIVNWRPVHPDGPELKALRQLISAGIETQKLTGDYTAKGLMAMMTTAMSHILAASDMSHQDIDRIAAQIRKGMPMMTSQLRANPAAILATAVPIAIQSGKA